MSCSLSSRPHEDWLVKVYDGIKSYSPPQQSVPSEVVPGVYEGGFQLWECTLDLLTFMKSMNFASKSVYELGCGRGLPGIYAALNGAARVVFQDFNKEVLEEVTIPNAILNGCASHICEFSDLNWGEIPEKTRKAEFDIILASETIYRKEQLQTFVNACKHLVKTDGIIIVAAKRMYFGLSGSVLDLIELINDEFSHEIHEFRGGSAYSRDIVVLKRNNIYLYSFHLSWYEIKFQNPCSLINYSLETNFVVGEFVQKSNRQAISYIIHIEFQSQKRSCLRSFQTFLLYPK